VSGQRTRARVFGEAADLYERRRPGYPDALYEDLIALVDPAKRTLEAGAGTGKATAELARRGLEVIALEPDQAMAEIASQACKGLSVEVREISFEDWDGQHESFDLVVAAQAWHWIDGDRGPAVARRALRRGGVLAAWWNQAGDWNGPVREALDAVYRRYAPDLAGSVVNSSVHPLRSDSLTLDGFELMEPRTYNWMQQYSAVSYCELLQTHSDHRMLPAEQLNELLRAVSEAIEEVSGGEINYAYRTDLLTARRTDEA
jgi:SAM-dependent methyltransferase